MTHGGSSVIARTIPRSVIESTGISGSGTDSSTAMIAALSSAFSATMLMTAMLHPFEGERDALSDSDAHSRESELATVPLKLLGRGQREPSAGHSEGMAEGDCSAVGV